MVKIYVILFVMVGTIGHVTSLSCIPCGSSPCEKPSCCSSGMYTLDVCGCCPICAKGENDSCGGPWNTSGICAKGLSCFRTCNCRTQTPSQLECIFPFKYKGIEHNECIKDDDTDSDQLWCAIKVDAEGNMEEKADCQNDCPGNAFSCDQSSLFNMDGKCVSDSVRKQIEEEQKEGATAIAFEFNPGLEDDKVEEAPLCDRKTENLISQSRCRCTERVAKGERGHCEKIRGFGGGDDQEFQHGWCFLEQISDPNSPTADCFEDVQWSPAAGMFWSNEACKNYNDDKLN